MSATSRTETPRYLWPASVPNGWQLGPIKRLISRMESGVSVNALDQPTVPGTPGVLKTSCVYTGEFDPNQNKMVIEAERHLVACPVQVGGLVVSRMNTPDLVGSAGLVREHLQDLYLPDRLWQVSFVGLDPRFAHYWTQSTLYRLNVQAACAGSSASMQNLSQDDFRGFPIAIPSFEVQGRLANLLDLETARIDALIEKKTRFIELLREKRQALITQAVTRGLDNRVELKDSGIDTIGLIPAHFQVLPLMHLTAYGRDIMYGIVLPGPDVGEGIPIVKGGNVRPERLRLDRLARTTPEIEAPFARARLLPDDIVYSIRGSIGDAELVPQELEGANITQDVARVSPGPLAKPRWLLYVLKSAAVFGQLDREATGATIRGINIFSLKRVMVPVPPLIEQEAIADFLDSRLAQMERLASATTRSLELLRERRAALITAAVTGQIDIREAA